MKIELHKLLREPSVATNVRLEGWLCCVEKIFQMDGKYWKVDLLPSEAILEAKEVIPVHKVTDWVEVSK